MTRTTTPKGTTMTAKICSICETRRVGAMPSVGDEQQARVLGYCTPCLVEAEWENMHSDYGHDENGPALSQADRLSGELEADHCVDECWICHPELIPALTPARAGTSRATMAQTPHQSHAGCHHVRTPKARAACRAAGGPGSAGSLALFPAPKTTRVRKAPKATGNEVAPVTRAEVNRKARKA